MLSSSGYSDSKSCDPLFLTLRLIWPLCFSFTVNEQSALPPERLHRPKLLVFQAPRSWKGICKTYRTVEGGDGRGGGGGGNNVSMSEVSDLIKHIFASLKSSNISPLPFFSLLFVSFSSMTCSFLSRYPPTTHKSTKPHTILKNFHQAYLQYKVFDSLTMNKGDVTSSTSNSEIASKCHRPKYQRLLARQPWKANTPYQPGVGCINH